MNVCLLGKARIGRSDASVQCRARLWTGEPFTLQKAYEAISPARRRYTGTGTVWLKRLLASLGYQCPDMGKLS
jgi:hypothetical protein